MGKKAPRRNAFFFFMRDFKRKQEAKGRRFENGYQGVSKVAGEAWKSLPQKEKDEYKREADDYNKSEERSQGVPLPGINVSKKKKKAPVPPNRALTLKEARQKREREYIMNLVDGMTINELLNYTFYLSHVNVFCKTEDDEFVPAEIAISRFSLKEGVTDVFHRIVSPGQTPLGYSYTIKEHSDKTHRIPLEFDKSTHAYLGMYKGIKGFLQPSGDTGRASVLYTMFDEPFHNCSMSAVKFSLKRIWETCNFADDDEDGESTEEQLYEKDFKVMSLPMLFFHLKNRCASAFNVEAVAFENTSEANIELLNDKYEFDEELACQFHKEIDNVRYCSQSYTVRWAQVIREQCLQNIVSDNEEDEPTLTPNSEENEKLKKEHDLMNKVEKRDETSPLKFENEIKKKEEKFDVKKERDRREIKDERDRDSRYKRERDDRYRSNEDSRYKKERDRGYSDERIKRERDRGYDDEKIKRERDRGYDDERIKRERDRGYDDDRYKRERDRGYDDDRYKRERDRGYDDDRYKRERDRGYGDDKVRERDRDRYDDSRIKRERDERHRTSEEVRVKKERDDRHRSSNEDVRVKKERDDRHRSSETEARSRTKRENLIPDYDLLKEEVLDIPADVKVERSSGSESRPRESTSYPSTSRESRIKQEVPSEVKVERSDSSRIKQENTNISTNVKVEHPKETPSNVKVEHPKETPSNVKVEHPKETPSNVEVEIKPHIKEEPTRPTIYVDITSDDEVKIEPIENRDSHSKDNSTRSSGDSKIKTELESVEIKPEHIESILKPEHLDIPLEVKSERIIDVDQPSAGSSKSRPSANAKIEHIDNVNQRPSGSNTSQDAKSTNSAASKAPQPVIPKQERDPEFPLPIPIKTEFPHQTEPSRRQAKSSETSSTIPPPVRLPLPTIKVEKDGEAVENRTQPATSTSQAVRETSSSVPHPIPLPLPMIKVEKDGKAVENRTQPATSTSQAVKGTSSSVPPPIPLPLPMIKVEKDGEVVENRTQPAAAIDEVVISEFPMPMVIKVEKEPTNQTKQSKAKIPMPIKIKSEIPQTSRSMDEIPRDDEFPLPKKIKLEDDPAVKTEPLSSSSQRVKKETPDFYSSHGMKNEEIVIDSEDCQSSLTSDSESMEWETCDNTESMVIKKEKKEVIETMSDCEIKEEKQ